MKLITRRTFLRRGITFGSLTLLGPTIIPRFLKAVPISGIPDIVTVAGDDPMGSLPTLLEPLGGIGKFVKESDSVGLLVNSPWVNPGTYTHPDVVLAVIRQCIDAGAGEIVCFKPVRDGYWEEGRYYNDMKEPLESISYGDERTSVSIPEGLYLKQADVFKAFLDVDVFINIPVAKHHNGTNFSGMLKGLMGVSTSDTNRHMHSPDGEYTYEKQVYLSQCIADLATLRKPDLCIMDAIECVTEKGPRGPGKTVKPNRILAGTDPVALDAYGATLMGIDISTVPAIEMASRHGLGEMDIDGLDILEIQG